MALDENMLVLASDGQRNMPHQNDDTRKIDHECSTRN